MEQNDLKADISQTIHGYYVIEKVDEEVPALLGMGCTAILCSHDVLACAVLDYCRDHIIRVPEDLSVIGFDDLPVSRHSIPPLTTVHQDRTELGKSAFYALSCQMSNILISTLQLHAKLIERETTGPLHKF